MTKQSATKALEEYIADLLADDSGHASAADSGDLAASPANGFGGAQKLTETQVRAGQASKASEESSAAANSDRVMDEGVFSKAKAKNSALAVSAAADKEGRKLPQKVEGKAIEGRDSAAAAEVHHAGEQDSQVKRGSADFNDKVEAASTEKTSPIKVTKVTSSADSRGDFAAKDAPKAQDFSPAPDQASTIAAAMASSELPSLRVHKSAPVEAEQDPPPAPLEEVKRQQLQELLNRKTAEIIAVKPQTKTPEPIVAELEPPPISVTSPKVEELAPVAEQEIQEASEDLPPALLAWGDNGRPVWAEGRFDVLLFDVSGLSLAVPLVALGQILPMTDKLTFLQGQSDWFMGILPTAAGDIRTVNTALFVMPERYQKRFLDTAKYVVTIDGLRWGLAVDSVKQPISLDPGDVKWRSQRSQRPWLAGTVKSHMCALLDIPQMGELLNNADKNYSVKD